MTTPFLRSPVEIIGPMLADDGYLTRKQRDPLDVTCVGVEDDQVLDAYAHYVVEVDARFYRENRRRRQGRLCRGHAERRHFVGGEANAVAQTMPEVVTVTGSVDDFLGNDVD